MLNTKKLTEWEKSAIISLMLSMLTDQQRSEVSRSLPVVYNKLAGEEVMKIETVRADPLILSKPIHAA